MFDSNKTITRIAGGIDLLIDVATLGEYGLEEVEGAKASKRPSANHAARSHTSFNPQPRSRRERCAPGERSSRNVIELSRFLRPIESDASETTPCSSPVIAGNGTTLAPVISINSRVAARQGCPDLDPDYTPCTPAARRLALAA